MPSSVPQAGQLFAAAPLAQVVEAVRAQQVRARGEQADADLRAAAAAGQAG